MRGLQPSPRSLHDQTDQPEETQLGTHRARAEGPVQSAGAAPRRFSGRGSPWCRGSSARWESPKPNDEGVRPRTTPSAPAATTPGSSCWTRVHAEAADSDERRLDPLRCAASGNGVTSANSWWRAPPPFLRPPSATSRLPRTSVKRRRKAAPGLPVPVWAREELGVMNKGAACAVGPRGPEQRRLPLRGGRPHHPGAPGERRGLAPRTRGLRAALPTDQSAAAAAPAPPWERRTAWPGLPARSRPGRDETALQFSRKAEARRGRNGAR
ncbi:hypothetical protein VULLAG_LOCUS18993 [Vulpes lagopus]